MIDFRYHLVSIISIFLALAVGIVLGAGPLKGSIGTTLTTELANVRKDKAELNDQLQAAKSLQAASNEFAADVVPGLVEGSLAGRRVALVLGPQAGDAAHKGVTDAVTAAGGSVVATVTVQGSFLDVEHATERQQAVAASATALGVTGAAADRPGAVLGRALMTGGAAPAPSADDATSALQALTKGGYVKVTRTDGAGDPTLAVVLPGAVSTTSADERSAQTSAYLALARGLDAGGAGTVLVSDTATAATDGSAASVVSAARRSNATSEAVSTVDDVDLPMGRAALALALAAQAQGASGRYGVLDDAQAVVPPLPATSSASPSPEAS